MCKGQGFINILYKYATLSHGNYLIEVATSDHFGCFRIDFMEY